MPRSTISLQPLGAVLGRAGDGEAVDQLVRSRFPRIEVDLARPPAVDARDAAARRAVHRLHRLHRLPVLAVIGGGDTLGRGRLEPGESRMRDDETANRLARARVALVRDRDLHVAPERERVGVAPGGVTGVARERDRLPETLDVGADREAHAVRAADRDVDRPRPGRRDVERRLRDVERRVDVVEPRHRRDDAVDLDVLAAQKALEPKQVLLEARHRHRLLLEHLHGAVAAADRERRASAGHSLQRRHRVGREEWMAQRHRNCGPDLQRRGRGGCEREDDVRIREQAVRLADGEPVPAARLERAREAADVG